MLAAYKQESELPMFNSMRANVYICLQLSGLVSVYGTQRVLCNVNKVNVINRLLHFPQRALNLINIPNIVNKTNMDDEVSSIVNLNCDCHNAQSNKQSKSRFPNSCPI